MLLDIKCSTVISFQIDLKYDDTRADKSVVVSVGDLVDVDFNYNGCRKLVQGRIIKLYAEGTILVVAECDVFTKYGKDYPGMCVHLVINGIYKIKATNDLIIRGDAINSNIDDYTIKFDKLEIIKQRVVPDEDEIEYGKYGNCPDCGVPLDDQNDGGNGFCKSCAHKH